MSDFDNATTPGITIKRQIQFQLHHYQIWKTTQLPRRLGTQKSDMKCIRIQITA
jgi:hypothetical protein